MSNYQFEDDELRKLQGKVVLITGAATGIGRSTAELAHQYGAKVAACDVNDARGRELEQQYKHDFLYRNCDITKWADLVSFFEATYDTLGPIDAVISNAAITKAEPFSDSSTLEPPDVSVININLIGTWYVTKCAVHFFKKHPDTPSQLVLFGSVASFIDTPPVYTYCASKGGVLALMRSLRTQLPKDNITVNMIAPWMTVTQMISEDFVKMWGDLPANQPLDVAKASLLPIVRPQVNGKSFLINGGIITEVEDKLDEVQHIWLGPELDVSMREGQRRLIP